jgi:thymidine kinase
MSIHLLLGCMLSGKSSELLRRLRRYKIGGKTTFLIKYVEDRRYNASNDELLTHDEYKTKCNHISDGDLRYIEGLDNVDVIGIDEGQFFSDIDTFAENWANKGKIIIIAALDSDYQRKPFGKVLKLIPLAEEYIKLTAICKCGSDASFSKRISKETEQKVIGGVDKYTACCRKCYFA